MPDDRCERAGRARARSAGERDPPDRRGDRGRVSVERAPSDAGAGRARDGARRPAIASSRRRCSGSSTWCPACRSLDDLARHLRGFLEEVPDAPLPIAAAMRSRTPRRGAPRSAPPPPAASSTWRTGSSSARPRAPRSACCAACGTAARRAPSTCSARRPSRRRRPTATPSAATTRSSSSRPRPASGPSGRCSSTTASGPLPRANVSVKVSALTPLLRPDAPERGRHDAAQRLRPLLERAQRARRPHPHRHGVARLPRGRARPGARAALRGAVPLRPVGRDRAAGLPARLPRARGDDPRLGARRRSGRRR